MTVDQDSQRTPQLICLEGELRADDAETLLQRLLEQPKPRVDLGQVTHLHAAVLQVLLATSAEIAVPPSNAWLAQALTRSTSTTRATSPQHTQAG
jgi:ABC-type transporter Mla MlaB component